MKNVHYFQITVVVVLLTLVKMGNATPLTFTYDELGRLTQFTLPAGNQVAYDYDANGNRLQETIVLQASFDTDADGIPTVFDNCGTTSNSSQVDADKDGKGDACDTPTWGQFMAGYYSSVGNKDGLTTEQFMVNNGLSSATQIPALPATTTNAMAKVLGVSGLSLDAGSDRLYFAEQTNNLIRHVALANGQVTKIAGSGSQWMAGYVDAVGLAARFRFPQQVSASADGAWLYVADFGNCVIRRINTTTTAVTTVAGVAPCPSDPQVTPNATSHQDGAAQSAKFYWPRGIAVAADGTVYVADTYNSAVRKIATSGIVSTLAGGPGNSIGMQRPNGLALIGNDLYVTDGAARVVWKISTSNGAVAIAVGKLNTAGSKSGVAGSEALLNYPVGIAGSGTTLFVADQDQNSILQVDVANNYFSTHLVGGPTNRGFVDGAFAQAKVDIPQWLAWDPDTKSLYVSDLGNIAVRKLNLNTKVVSTVMGLPEIKNKYVDGDAAVARFDSPSSIVRVSDTTLLVTDTGNCALRLLTLGANYGKIVNGKYDHALTVSTFAGQPSMCAGWKDGPYPLDVSDKSNGASAIFYNPTAVTTDRQGTFAYVAGEDRTIRRVSVGTASGTTPGATHLVAGAALSTKLTPANVATVSPNVDGTGATAKFSQINDLFYIDEMVGTASTPTLYVLTPTAVRRVSLASADYGKVTTPLGHPSETGDKEGTGTEARFKSLERAAYHNFEEYQYLYVTDSGNHKVYALNLQTAQVKTLAGSGTQTTTDGIGTSASFNAPMGIALIPLPSYAYYLYISDSGSSKLRRIDMQDGTVTTVAGSGIAGSLDGVGLLSDWTQISDMVYVSDYSRIFVTDSHSRSIRQLTPDLPK